MEFQPQEEGRCAKPTLSERHWKEVLETQMLAHKKYRIAFGMPNEVLAQGNNSINSLET